MFRLIMATGSAASMYSCTFVMSGKFTNRLQTHVII